MLSKLLRLLANCDHLELIVVVIVYCIRVYFFGHTMSCDCQSVSAESNIRIFLFLFFILFLYKIKILLLPLLHFTSTYICRVTIVPKVRDDKQFQNLKQQAVL